ncbi:MAG TPA: hypothetical protein DCM57_01380 [Treponema sp.]|nr:hypothetical protein [Treponema sp.]
MPHIVYYDLEQGSRKSFLGDIEKKCLLRACRGNQGEVMKKRIFAAVFAVTAAFAFADRPDSSGKWIVRYRGDNVELVGAKASVSGDVVVPDTIDGLPVTGLRESAFEDEDDITSVRLPKTVQKIGENAFSGCGSLKKINLEELTSLESIGMGTFEYCRELTDVKLPAGLKAIGTDAFYECSSLKSIVIPVSVRVIGEDAFDDTGIDRVRIPEPTHISRHVFDSSVLHEVFEGSQAAKVMENCGYTYDYIFVKDGEEGSGIEYSDYDAWKDSGFEEVSESSDSSGSSSWWDSDEIDEDAMDIYDSYDDEDMGPVAKEDLAAMVDRIVEIANSGKLSVSDMGTVEGMYGCSYLLDDDLIYLVDPKYAVPYVCEICPSDDGGKTPNFVYVIYGRPNSENREYFGYKATRIVGQHMDDIIDKSIPFADVYEQANKWVIEYRKTVKINGVDYEVLCTDVDGD